MRIAANRGGMDKPAGGFFISEKYIDNFGFDAYTDNI